MVSRSSLGQNIASMAFKGRSKPFFLLTDTLQTP